MAEKDTQALENIVEVVNTLPPFEQGRLYGYAARVVEEREAKSDPAPDDKSKQ